MDKDKQAETIKAVKEAKEKAVKGDKLVKK